MFLKTGVYTYIYIHPFSKTHIHIYLPFVYIYIYVYNFKFLVWNGFQRALNFLGAVLNYSKRFQASKVFHRFNATGLFRIVNG